MRFHILKFSLRKKPIVSFIVYHLVTHCSDNYIVARAVRKELATSIQLRVPQVDHDAVNNTGLQNFVRVEFFEVGKRIISKYVSLNDLPT